MPKIPQLEKFRGDNEQSFATWIKKFEAHCVVLEVAEENHKRKWRDLLLVTTEGDAFDTVTTAITADAAITYVVLKATLSTKYGGANYKRFLEMKLRSLKFSSGSKIPEFLHELRSTIREYYNIQPNEAIDQIGMSLVLSTLEPVLKADIEILQLAGNTKLENVLELISSKLKAGYHPEYTPRAAASSVSNEDRISRLESMIEKIASKVSADDHRSVDRTSVMCGHCHKPGHLERSCFLLRKCFKCNKIGHISRFCTESSLTNSAGLFDTNSANLPSSERIFLKVGISSNVVDLLYDTGSMYTMIKREIYDKLETKPALIPLEKSGIGATGHKFRIDGVAFLNLKLLKDDGSFYNIEYEPVLVSPDIMESYYGIYTEKKFEEISRNSNNKTLTYRLKGSNEKVSLKYYVVSETYVSSIKVAKTIIIPDKTISMVKGRVSNFGKFNKDGTYALLAEEDEKLDVPNILLDNINTKIIQFAVENTSGTNMKLKKGDSLTDIYEVNEVEVDCIRLNSTRDVNENARLDTGDLNEGELKRLKSILQNYEVKMRDFPETMLPKIPIEHKIKLKDDEPVYSKPHRLPHHLKKEVESQVDKWLEMGFVEPTHSPYGAPLVPVKKKNGSYRICGDFRKINEKTIPAKYPIPRMDDLIISTGDSNIFTTIDIKNAYHHIQMASEDRHKTACVTESRKFQWVRMPPGLTGAAYSWTEGMEYVLKECKEFVKVFFDDILIHSRGKEAHWEHFSKVLETLAKHGIHVNVDKCQFIKNEVKFLGHVINSDGILPDVRKIDEIVHFKVPTTTKEVKSFLGMAGFYKKFIKDFSVNSQPMFDLLKKDTVFSWDNRCEEGFQYIKYQIVEPSKLYRPDYTKDFILQTDAADKAIGYVLLQHQDGELRPIQYGGRVLTETERRYATIDKELLAIYYAVKRNEVFILGTNVTVYTDHKPLLSLRNFRDVINKRFRWIAYLEEIGVSIRYIAGNRNVIADYISRHPKEKLDVIKFASIDFINKIENNYELLEGQLADEGINCAIKWVNDKTNELPKELKSKQDLLSIVNGLLTYSHHGRNLIVAPQCMRSEIMMLAHSHFSGGHFGIFKTHRRILEKFWWSSIFNDVKTFINNCEVCIKIKPLGKKRSMLGKTRLPTKPMELVSIDYLTELPVTKDGNKHLMVINDHFSKFIQVYPVADRTARTGSVVLVDYILRFGSPIKLYSDQDPSYESELFQNVAKKLGVKKTRTTPYNPQANGLTEQSNSMVKNYLASYVNENRDNWDKYGRELAFAYNTSVHKSTGLSPVHLFFGRRLNAPLDIVYGEIENDSKISDFTTFKRKMENIYEHARKTMAVQQDVSATYYDRKVINDPLKCGELVYVYLPRNRRVKLAHKWAGPAKVEQCNHPLYEIKQLTEKGEVVMWTVRNKLKRAPSNTIWREEIDVNDEISNTQVTEPITYASSDSDDEQYHVPNGGDVQNPDENEIVDQENEEDGPHPGGHRHNLRDRNRWGRYYGMDAYMAMFVC